MRLMGEEWRFCREKAQAAQGSEAATRADKIRNPKQIQIS
jgi:hypothetical protein